MASRTIVRVGGARQTCVVRDHYILLVAQRSRIHPPNLSSFSSFRFLLLPATRECGITNQARSSVGGETNVTFKYYTESNQEQLTLQLC